MSRISVLERLVWWEPLWILLLTPFVLFQGRFLPLAWHPFIIGALFLGGLLRTFVYQNVSISAPANWCIGFLLAWLPINFWAASDKTLAWEHMGYLCLGVSFYFALINWPVAQRRPQLVAWMLISVNIGLALWGPIIFAYYPTKLFNVSRVQNLLQPVASRLGETMHPNILAGALIITASLLVALVLGSNRGQSLRRSARFMLSIGLLCTFGVIGLTQSRGGYLGILIASGVICVLIWPRLFYGLSFVVLAVLAGAYWLGSERVLNLLIATDPLGGLDGRIELWSRALFVLTDFPLTGIGMGTFQKVVPVLYPYFLLSPENAPHSHNLFLQVGVDLGLPGLIAYLGLLINVFVMLMAILRQRTYDLHWQLGAGALGAMVAMVVHGCLDAVTWGTKLAFIPWLLFALVTLLFLQAQQSSASAHLRKLCDASRVMSKE
ncbi:MAG: O-antigen ligase family protein [Caldilineaceae bacterium]|nr:O-antigen ligase family protein [Caldilineaceae bacterium]